MSSVSPLANIHSKGQFGDHEGKNEKNLIKLTEKKNLLIVQIAQYKNSSIKIENLKIDNLYFKNEVLNISANKDTRIIWNSPNNWLLFSSKHELLKEILDNFKQSVILRPSIVYSVDDNFTTQLMTLLGLLPVFPIYYDGKTKFRPIHCSDLTNSITKIINDDIKEKIIEFVGPEEMTFREILEKLLSRGRMLFQKSEST